MCNLSQSVLERGERQGEIKGEMKKAVAVARKMLAKGKLTVEEIAEYSGLPTTKILELKYLRGLFMLVSLAFQSFI